MSVLFDYFKNQINYLNSTNNLKTFFNKNFKIPIFLLRKNFSFLNIYKKLFFIFYVIKNKGMINSKY